MDVSPQVERLIKPLEKQKAQRTPPVRHRQFLDYAQHTQKAFPRW